MRWIGGRDVRDFRIDLQLGGKKTVLCSRWEKRTRETFDGRTFGFSFEKASTEVAPGCKDSGAHHRIVSYVGLLFYSYRLKLIIDFLGSQWAQDGGPI